MNEYNKTGRLIDTENKLVVARGKGVGRGARLGNGIKRYKLLGIK